MCSNSCISFFCSCRKKQYPEDIKYELLSISKQNSIDALASLKSIIENNTPPVNTLEDLKPTTYEDPEGFSITYTHDLINKYRVFLHYNDETYQGASTVNWYDAAENLFTASSAESLKKTAETILNPYD